GDLSGDGKADIIWLNTSTNQIAYWMMDGLDTIVTGGLSSGTAAYTAVDIGSCGGATGCFFWNDSGASGMVGFNGFSFCCAASYFVAPWQIVGVGNFDGDLYSDLVWQHPDGRVSMWLLGLNGQA